MQRSPRQVGLTAVTVLTMAIALTVVTGPTASAGPDLSTRAAIESYLVSIGVNPADAVWQEDLRNYAGPSCPGAGWNCVGANAPVVQIADPLGKNLFYCTGLDCVVVQVALSGGQNGGACDRTDKHSATAVQVCDITQANDGNPSSTNAAGIQQSIQQSSGSPQNARQVARITQTNSVGRNIAHIHQVVGQTQNTKGSAPITQTQEAHQAATVSQTTLDLLAPELGDNSSNVRQRQNQSQRARVGGTGSTITQNQNTTFVGDEPCDQPEDVSYDQAKNQCANVTQHSGVLDVGGPLLAPGGGDNKSALNHQITQRQTAEKAGTVNQSQGAFSSGEAGNKEQLSSGVSDGTATQDMVQVQTAPPNASVFQDQDTGDPRCCWRQFGNDSNSADILQTTNQSSSSNGFQSATLQADCDSSGTCHVEQSATTNNESETNECTSDSCHELLVCFEGEGSFCESGGVD